MIFKRFTLSKFHMSVNIWYLIDSKKVTVRNVRFSESNFVEKNRALVEEYIVRLRCRNRRDVTGKVRAIGREETPNTSTR